MPHPGAGPHDPVTAGIERILERLNALITKPKRVSEDAELRNELANELGLVLPSEAGPDVTTRTFNRSVVGTLVKEISRKVKADLISRGVPIDAATEDYVDFYILENLLDETRPIGTPLPGTPDSVRDAVLQQHVGEYDRDLRRFPENPTAGLKLRAGYRRLRAGGEGLA